MSKGVEVKCKVCGTDQEVTDLMAHDVFGFTLDQVQHILHDYREQVPHAEANLKRKRESMQTRLVMVDLITRFVLDVERTGRVSQTTVKDAQGFLESLISCGKYSN